MKSESFLEREKESLTVYPSLLLSLLTVICWLTLCGISTMIIIRILPRRERYSILGLTGLLSLMSCVVMSSRGLSESFTALWSAIMLLTLSIGGTMIMRKFHNSMAVGFFMGGVVAMSQMFFFLFLLYIGYGKDQKIDGLPIITETAMAFFSIIQCVLLGTFAAILGAHRSEILDKPDETPNTEFGSTPYTRT